LVNDMKGNFMFYLNTLKMPVVQLKRCPKTTIWNNQWEKKEVYMLQENDAIRININN
jgi:hypothetical protein